MSYFSLIIYITKKTIYENEEWDDLDKFKRLAIITELYKHKSYFFYQLWHHAKKIRSILLKLKFESCNIKVCLKNISFDLKAWLAAWLEKTAVKINLIYIKKNKYSQRTKIIEVL